MASLRLVRFAKLQTLGLIPETTPGYVRAIADTVCGGALWLPEQNIPKQADKDPGHNFHHFISAEEGSALKVNSKLSAVNLCIKKSVLQGHGSAALGEGVFLTSRAQEG